MAGKAFVDTNIMLRAFHQDFAEHQKVRALFDRVIDEGYELWISRQVIREYIAQATNPRTFKSVLSIGSVEEQLKAIQRVCSVADETEDVTIHLLNLLKAYPTGGKQVHDANIVATMLANQIDTLLTLNIDDFKRFEAKIALVSPVGN